MELRIEEVRPRTDLSLYELYKSVKTAINASTLKEAKEFIDKIQSVYFFYIEEEQIVKLKSAFTFRCQSVKDREIELELQKHKHDEEEKRKTAIAWFNTLRPELQKHIPYLVLQSPRA